MTTMEDSQEHKITLKGLTNAEENILTSTPLLGNGRRTHAIMQSNFHYRCRRQRCCVSSKAALLILLWNVILVAGFESLLDPNFFRALFTYMNHGEMTNISVVMYSVVAFLFLFYPLAGCLADIRWGRYKTVVYSVRVIWGSLVAMAVLGGVAVASIMVPAIVVFSAKPDDNYPNTIQLTMIFIVSVVFGIPTLVAFLLIPCGLVSVLM